MGSIKCLIPTTQHHTYKPMKYLCLVAALCLSSCGSQPEKKQAPETDNSGLLPPLPRTITVENPKSPSITGAKPLGIKKNMFHIEVSPSFVKANNSPLVSLTELEELLRSHNKPLITLAIHKCMDTVTSKKIFDIVQNHTDMPITFASFGEYDDSDCK